MKFLIPLTASLALFAGCTPQQATVQTGPNAEVTFDGLVRVDNSRMRNAWVKPGFNLAGYSKFMVAPAEFEFRAVRDTGRSRSSSQTEFPISDTGKQRLIDAVTDVFQEELANSQYFTRVDEPGPDVLLIEGALLDIVSRVPPEIRGRGDTFISRVGEATLVIQLVDSMSGETLARAVDRRAAEPAGGRGVRASPVTSINEVRRVARRWASLLRERREKLHELGPIL